jgi:enhancer of polycomb-like protein
MLSMERQLFLQRAEVKEMKRKLGIKDDDEDLINQKVSTTPHQWTLTNIKSQPKKKPMDANAVQRQTVPQLRIPSRPGAQAADDLQLLEDVQAEKENEIIRDIKQNLAKHIKWNEGYIDMTRAPLTPSPKKSLVAAFRPAITAQLPTPPSSDASEDANDSPLETKHSYFRDKFAPQVMDIDNYPSRIPSFRRRIGRGGRIMIDRRNVAQRCNLDDLDPIKLDRFKYDTEDEDDDLVFDRDMYDIQVMQYRALMTAKARDQALATVQSQAQAQAQAQRRLQSEQNITRSTSNPGPSPGPNPSIVSGPKGST